jgi:antirestriction protein ArdC
LCLFSGKSPEAWPSKINVSLNKMVMKTTSEKKDMYAVINNMIIEKLQNGKMPWKQTWNNYGPARNYVSKKAYRGINALILNNTEFEYPLFLTFLQVKELGGHIKKGSKSIPVIYWKTLQFEKDDEIKKIPFLRYYNVFNIECVDCVKFKLPTKYVNDAIENCESIVGNMPSRPVIEHGGDQPYYNWKEDKVKVPHRDNFTTSDEYYATLFHEVSHSTGHESRLNRETCMKPAVYGSRDYCKEELVAEIATCFLCGEAGITNSTIDNSAAYIGFWLERLTHLLREDNKAFVKASAQAQKATDFILNRVEELILQE